MKVFFYTASVRTRVLDNRVRKGSGKFADYNNSSNWGNDSILNKPFMFTTHVSFPWAGLHCGQFCRKLFTLGIKVCQHAFFLMRRTTHLCFSKISKSGRKPCALVGPEILYILFPVLQFDFSRRFESSQNENWSVMRPGARFSKLPVITGPVKLFCFPF